MPVWNEDYTWPTKGAPNEGPWRLVATHTEIDEVLQYDGTVKLTKRTVCFFREKDRPLAPEYPIPSIDCDHEKREICR